MPHPIGFPRFSKGTCNFWFTVYKDLVGLGQVRRQLIQLATIYTSLTLFEAYNTRLSEDDRNYGERQTILSIEKSKSEKSRHAAFLITDLTATEQPKS